MSNYVRILKDGKKIIADVAIRDGDGKNIANNYAKQNGAYEDLTAGLAINLKSTTGNLSDASIEFRSAGGSADISDGWAEIKAIYGNTTLESGEFVNSTFSGIYTIGFNQWNGEYVFVLPSSTFNGYCLSGGYSRVLWYETLEELRLHTGGVLINVTQRTNGEGDNYFGFDITEQGYIEVEGANNSTCVSFVWSGYRVTDYEAYWIKHVEFDTSEYFSDGMMSINSTRDEINNNYVIQRVAKVVFDGTETISVVESGGGEIVYKVSKNMSNYGTQAETNIAGLEPTVLIISGTGTLTSQTITNKIASLTPARRLITTKLVISGFTRESSDEVIWKYNFSLLPNLNDNIWYGSTKYDFSILSIVGPGVGELTTQIIDNNLVNNTHKASIIQIKYSGYTDYSVALTYDYSALTSLEYVWTNNIRWQYDSQTQQWIATYFYPLSTFISSLGTHDNEVAYFDYSGIEPDMSAFTGWGYDWYDNANRSGSPVAQMQSGRRYYLQLKPTQEGSITILGSGALTEELIKANAKQLTTSDKALAVKVILPSAFTSYTGACLVGLNDFTSMQDLDVLCNSSYNGHFYSQWNASPSNKITLRNLKINLLDTYFWSSNEDKTIIGCVNITNQCVINFTTYSSVEIGVNEFANKSSFNNLIINTPNSNSTTSFNARSGFAFRNSNVSGTMTLNCKSKTTNGISFNVNRVVYNGTLQNAYLGSNLYSFGWYQHYTYFTGTYGELLNTTTSYNRLYVPAEHFETYYLTQTNFITMFGNNLLFGYLDYMGTIPTFTDYTATWYEDEDCTVIILPSAFVSGHRYFCKLTWSNTTLTITGSGTLTTNIINSFITKTGSESSIITKVVISNSLLATTSDVLAPLSTLSNLEELSVKGGISNQSFYVIWNDTKNLSALPNIKKLNWTLSGGDMALGGYSNVAKVFETVELSINGAITGTSNGSLFRDCGSKLKHIKFNEGITSLAMMLAFESCSKIEDVDFASTITSFTSSYGFNPSFSGMGTATDNGTIIYLRSLSLITAPSFGNCKINKIYVPADLVDTYKTAEGWSTYADKIEAIS